MSGVEYLCGDCFAPLESVTDEWVGGRAVRGRTICSGCGMTVGTWIDGGLLDLDEIRANPPDNAGNFIIFP